MDEFVLAMNPKGQGETLFLHYFENYRHLMHIALKCPLSQVSNDSNMGRREADGTRKFHIHRLYDKFLVITFSLLKVLCERDGELFTLLPFVNIF